MVENFGSYLKHERELRGVPLEEISGATKIHIRFLQALEDNKFEELPGEVFIKGYIRSYADTIGSDVEEMLNIYEESVGHKALENNLNSENKSNISAKNFLGFAVTGIFYYPIQKNHLKKKVILLPRYQKRFLKKNLLQSLKKFLKKKKCQRKTFFLQKRQLLEN